MTYRFIYYHKYILKSRNLPNTDVRNYSIECGNFWSNQYFVSIARVELHYVNLPKSDTFRRNSTTYKVGCVMTPERQMRYI